MAKTRSKGSASPRTPQSAKVKKVANNIKSPAVSSPLANKKKAKAVKKAEPEPAQVKQAAITKAISELAKYVNQPKEEGEKDKKSLFDDEDAEDHEFDLTLQITGKKYFSDKTNLKPKIIELAKGLHNTELTKTCLIVRDLLVTTEAQLSSIEEAEIPTLNQIYTVTQIKKEFKQYEKKRQLYSEYDVFVVDDSILNLMPTLLGKTFYNSNTKIPVPIRVTSSTNKLELSLATLKNQIAKVLNSTSYLLPVGTNISIKVGNVNALSAQELQENVQKAVAHFPLDKIKTFSLKCTNSPSLPIFLTDSLFGEGDVADATEKSVEQAAANAADVKLSKFERALIELGDADEAIKIMSKKQGSKQKKTGKKSNKVHK